MKSFFSIRDNGTIKSIFDNVELSRTPAEILKFVRIKLVNDVHNQLTRDGRIRNKKNDHLPQIECDEYANQNVYFGDDEKEDGVLRKTDTIVYQEYADTVDHNPIWNEFIEYIGSIKEILSEKQKYLYILKHNDSLTQQDIADELGITQQAVSNMESSIRNRVKKKYQEFVTLKQVSKNKDTYRTTKGFIQQHKNIIEYDVTDSFDYFGYFINFLQTNYRQDEEKTTVDELHKNRNDFYTSVIDILTDYINRNTYKIVEEYIFKNKTNLKLTQRKKDSFVMNVLKAFNKYLDDVNNSYGALTEKIAKEGENQKYIDLLL